MAPILLAWSSKKNNSINVVNLRSKENNAEFQGIGIKEGTWIFEHRSQ